MERSYGSGGRRRPTVHRCWSATETSAPATRPQKAEPTEWSVSPEAVTRNVIERRLPVALVREGGGEPVPDRAEQREAGDREDELLREGGEEAGDGGPEEPDDR